MAIFKEADTPFDPHDYLARSFKVKSDGTMAADSEQGTWTTVVHRFFDANKIDETRIIEEGMSEETMKVVHRIVNNNPEVAFRYGTPVAE